MQRVAVAIVGNDPGGDEEEMRKASVSFLRRQADTKGWEGVSQKCQDRADPPTVKGAEFPRKGTYGIPYPQDSSPVHSYLDFFESQWDRNSRTLCARALSRGFTSLGFFCSGCHVQKPQEAPQTASSPAPGGDLHYWPSLDLQGGTTSRTAA